MPHIGLPGRQPPRGMAYMSSTQASEGTLVTWICLVCRGAGSARTSTTNAFAAAAKRVGRQWGRSTSRERTSGFWVQLDDVFTDGFAHISTLGEEWFEFDDERLTLRGEMTGVVYRLGQRVGVRLDSVDFTALELSIAVTGLL